MKTPPDRQEGSSRFRSRVFGCQPRSGRALALAIVLTGGGIGGAPPLGGQPSREPESGVLTVVLETARLPDADVLQMQDGEQQAGVLRNEAFRLRTSQGELAFPARIVAGIRLSDGRGGLDSIVTVTRDRFSGFLEDPVFQLEARDSGKRIEVRRERVLKVLVRRRNDEPGLAVGSPIVLLKNGDFFSGALLEGRFLIKGTKEEWRWSPDRAARVTFANDDGSACRIVLPTGQELQAAPAVDDLEFQTGYGLRLRIYRGWIDEIRSPGVFTAELSRRIGVPGSEGNAGPAARAPVKSGVRPVEGMIWIAPGEYVMGSPTQEKDRDLDEGPQTRIVLPDGFWIGQHEVTQAEYQALMGTNPSQYLGDDRRPVEKVNWQEAVDYCRKLTERERAAGHLQANYEYRLPSEQEWEYACRAGTTTRFSYGNDPAYVRVGEYAWHIGNSESTTHPVEQKKPNPWGLYDMHGNALEWCLDEWTGAFPGGALTNTAAPPAGTLRVARGGSWLYEARFCRSANRDSYGMFNRCSDVGFRVVLARIQD
jgi:formylglycine-generating enzyme required for sulfatase activity